MTSAVSKSSLTSRQKQRIGSIPPQENTSLFLITSRGFTNYTGERQKKEYALREIEQNGHFHGGEVTKSPVLTKPSHRLVLRGRRYTPRKVKTSVGEAKVKQRSRNKKGGTTHGCTWCEESEPRDEVAVRRHSRNIVSHVSFDGMQEWNALWNKIFDDACCEQDPVMDRPPNFSTRRRGDL
ncbi:hypothetical protein TNCV_1961021 [Trichonephila clavipes]|nr:hypothetical protein TNCV_1961021 [Trichonephila clavipes]